MWEYIDEISVDTFKDPSVIQDHVDTRDFHCLIKQCGECNGKSIYSSLNEYAFIDRGEVKTFIKNIETISGGKAIGDFLTLKVLIQI